MDGLRGGARGIKVAGPPDKASGRRIFFSSSPHSKSLSGSLSPRLSMQAPPSGAWSLAEGMILFSELSRRQIRSISSLIMVCRQEPSMVLRVDRDKGYIDLSKRRVSEEEALTCEDRCTKSKFVHSIMRHAAETLEVVLEPLYERCLGRAVLATTTHSPSFHSNSD